MIYQSQDGSTAIIGEGARLGPAGDPSSDVAGWFEKTAGVAELVVYDVAKDKELARAGQPQPRRPTLRRLHPGRNSRHRHLDRQDPTPEAR